MAFSFIKEKLRTLQQRSLFIGLFSLLWFLLRTGTKPSRFRYPCQRTAAANGSLWLTAALVPVIYTIPQKLSTTDGRGKKLVGVLVTLIVIVAGVVIAQELQGPPNTPVTEGMGLTFESHVATITPASSIFVVNGTTRADDGFSRLITLMGQHDLRFYQSDVTKTTQGPAGLIAKDDVVLIKVNSQWDARGGTNTDLLRTLIEGITKHPDGFIGEIVVADNGQAQFGSLGTGGSLDWANSNAADPSQSVQTVVNLFAGSYQVSTYLWDAITLTRVQEYAQGDLDDGYVVSQSVNPTTGIRVSYPKFTTPFGTYISFKRGVWSPASQSYDSTRLKVINMPVLKTHATYGVTACVKHYMGVVSDRLTDHTAHQSVRTGGMGTEMVETRMPTLNILDALWINADPRGGPRSSYSDATRVNVLLASLDPVALDSWAAKHVLTQAAQRLGFTDLSTMDPESTAPGAFGNWLRLSMHELTKAGYQVTTNEDQMNVYVVNPS